MSSVTRSTYISIIQHHCFFATSENPIFPLLESITIDILHRHPSLINLLHLLTNSLSNLTFQSDEITYAELSLTNQQMPHVIYNQQSIPMTVIRRPEPTVYAQIDITKRMPPCLQTLSPPHPSTFQTLHHPHLPPYMPRPIREEQMIQDNAINSETPLINPRESSVSETVH